MTPLDAAGPVYLLLAGAQAALVVILAGSLFYDAPATRGPLFVRLAFLLYFLLSAAGFALIGGAALDGSYALTGGSAEGWAVVAVRALMALVLGSVVAYGLSEGVRRMGR